MEKVRDFGLLTFGVCVLGAEIWLMFSDPAIAVPLMMLTLVTLFVVGNQLWQEYR